MRQAVIVILAGIVCLSTSLASAQDPLDPSATPPSTDNEETDWSNIADLGIVFTSGNSSTSNTHFDNKLTRTGARDVWLLRLGGLRSKSADDRFAVYYRCRST